MFATWMKDLDEKLCFSFLRCSRWYWSTVNPLRRCKYTCTVREVRPVLPEKPVEEMPNQGDNHTIAHSPCPLPGARFTPEKLQYKRK